MSVINKEDAIKAFEAIDEMYPYRIPGKPETYDHYNEGWSDATDKAVQAIEALPDADGGWIPVEERLPEEDHWLGGSGKQFSDNVLVSIINRDDEDEWVDISQTIDGNWTLELPRHCKITAWRPLPPAFKPKEDN